jgi:hypothetical protein
MGVIGIEGERDAGGELVHPIETTIEDFHAEVAVDQKIFGGWLIGG